MRAQCGCVRYRVAFEVFVPLFRVRCMRMQRMPARAKRRIAGVSFGLFPFRVGMLIPLVRAKAQACGGTRRLVRFGYFSRSLVVRRAMQAAVRRPGLVDSAVGFQALLAGTRSANTVSMAVTIS